MKLPEVGTEIYITSSMSISNGSQDRVGGLAKVSCVTAGGFVEVEEVPGVAINWKYLAGEQESLRQRFGDKRAYPDPDIDRPWIESGDIVNGQKYEGEPIW